MHSKPKLRLRIRGETVLIERNGKISTAVAKKRHGLPSVRHFQMEFKLKQNRVNRKGLL